MPSVAVFLTGPAGSGKSTLCSSLIQHCETIGRPVHLVNLDPAAEQHTIKPSVDIKDLVSVEDVMDELEYGPNGALVWCLEYLLEHGDFLDDQIGDYDNDYLLVDCPGQIEIYTHYSVMRDVIRMFASRGYNTCALYLVESSFMTDTAKYFSACLAAMSTMVRLDCPMINVMSKMDLTGIDLKELDEFSPLQQYLVPDRSLLDTLKTRNTKHRALTTALVDLIDEYNMVGFVPVNIKDEESLEALLYQIDTTVQYFDDQEPKEPRDVDSEGADEQE